MNATFARRLLSASLALWLCATASAITVTDNFNNNLINTALWRKHRIGGVNILERNARLEMPASNTGFASGAALEVKPWGINWKYNFSLQANYYFNIPQPIAGRAATLVIALAFESNLLNNDVTGVITGLVRDHDGLWLYYGVAEDGNVVQTNRKLITQVGGTLRLTWNKATDRLTITAGGKTLNVYGLYSSYGGQYGNDPVLVFIGAVTANGNVPFAGWRAYFDNFMYTGNVRWR